MGQSDKITAVRLYRYYSNEIDNESPFSHAWATPNTWVGKLFFLFFCFWQVDVVWNVIRPPPSSSTALKLLDFFSAAVAHSTFSFEVSKVVACGHSQQPQKKKYKQKSKFSYVCACRLSNTKTLHCFCLRSNTQTIGNNRRTHTYCMLYVPNRLLRQLHIYLASYSYKYIQIIPFAWRCSLYYCSRIQFDKQQLMNDSK